MAILFLFGFILVVLVLVGTSWSAQSGAPPPSQHQPVASKRQRRFVPDGAPPPSQHQPVAAKRRRRWVPAGESVTVGKREIGGMVYVDRAPNRYRGEFAHGLIDPSLPVDAHPTDPEGAGLDYWPDYATISKRSRASYLEWLASGRSDAKYGVGYVFMYFYGLERRFFVDRPDSEERSALIAEVERLLQIYGSNRSIRGYFNNFLAAARFATSTEVEFPPAFDPSWQTPISVQFMIGRQIRDRVPISADWMLSWYVTHPETSLRTAAKRASREFQALFRIRFDERFSEGLKIGIPKRRLSFSYQAASGDFTASLDQLLEDIPDISRLTAPITKITPIVEKVTDELDRYSRYLGRNSDRRGTLRAHALLPSALQKEFPCAELDALSDWTKERISEGALTPVETLLEHLEGAPPPNLGKQRLVTAAEVLALVSVGMAPDPRYGVRSPKNGEPVVLFALPPDTAGAEEVGDRYRAALLSLLLGAFIAHADGIISEMERRQLADRIQKTPDLTVSERARLHADLDWMISVKPDLPLIRRRVQHASEQARRELGRVALAVVVADGIVDPAEIKAVERVYRTLGLDPAGLYGELHALAASPDLVAVVRRSTPSAGHSIPPQPADTSSPTPTGPIRLDPDRVSAIMADTAQVSRVLHEIFQDESDREEGGDGSEVAVPEVAKQFTGLDAAHCRLVKELIARPEWTPAEFEELARRSDLPPAGALETINEWAFDRFDDALIEDDDPLELNPEIRSALTAGNEE